ncbi:MAG: hypothetical protein HC851_14265 [Acaryochloris sp. RU_4_1]|nr:hypothetical protein [Acaryochloris sp. RU_4_1]NJR56020.1 hypothetical protein [Acaryochloris sp. CRU_2_0]
MTATLQAQQGRQAIPQPHALAALSGQWQSPSLTLIGDSSALNLCSDPSKATLTKRPGNVRLQIKGNFAADPVTGKIMAGDNSPPLSFSGHKKNSSASTNSSKKPAPKK